MNTVIKYLNAENREPSNCGEPLEIELSSRNLQWDGILVEKGRSKYFQPNNVITSSFYFALELENSYSWSAKLEDENSLELKSNPSDIWINPPFTAFTHKIDEPCKFLIITIEEEVLLKYIKVEKEKLRFLRNYNIQDKTIEYIMHLFLEEVKNQGENGKEHIENLVKLLANYFLKNYSNYEDLKNKSKSSYINGEAMEKINQLLEENLVDGISILEMAKILNMSKFHFLNEFKKINGITPYKYLIEFKIKKAMELLKKSNKSIVEIGLELGFNDNSHFTRTFKKQIGKSPLEWRKN